MEKYLLSCITKKALQTNLKKKKGERAVIEAWMNTYDNIDSGSLDEIELITFFKGIITNDKTHLTAFRVVTKISSALTLAIEQTTTSNHFKTLDSKIGGYNRNDLKKAIGCDRGELSKLLNQLGLGKSSRKENFSGEEASEIKFIYHAYENKDSRIKAYKAMKKEKNLTALSEEDLFVSDSKKLNKMNKKTGIFDKD